MRSSRLLPVLVFVVVLVLASCASKGGKGFGVIELVDQVAANEDAWKGEVVSVAGHVSVTSNSSGADLFVDLRNDRDTSVESHVICRIKTGVLPEGISGKTISVRGTVKKFYRQNYLNLRNVTLEPCEIIE